MLEIGIQKVHAFEISQFWPSSSPFSHIFKQWKKYVIKQWLFEQMTEDVQNLLKEHNILVSFDDKRSLTLLTLSWIKPHQTCKSILHICSFYFLKRKIFIKIPVLMKINPREIL